jgi:DNA-binding transcriptional LysR family regulator
MTLRAVNLNLIPVLQALLRHQNVSRAAAVLNISQPTVSAALTQLREVFADPLLIRIGRKMELTPRARDLIKPVEDACEALDNMLKTTRFDPALASRVFTIATSDHMPGLLGPLLTQALHRLAPGINLHFAGFSTDASQRHRLGEIDFVVMPRVVTDMAGFQELRIRHLCTEEFVHVVNPAHPLANQAVVTDADIAAHPRALFALTLPIPEGAGAAYGMVPASQGGSITRFEQINALPLMATLGNMVATIPRRLAAQWQGFSALKIISTALPPIDICLSWSPLLEADPAHRWLRNVMVDVVAREWGG